VRFDVRIDIDAIDFINFQTDKSRRIIEKHLKALKEDPFPGSRGDKELLNLRPGVTIYRLHIARMFTAFYEIEESTVFVNEVMTIEQAHKKYKGL
jgi:mRNA-degrading endonuclease RelE of RelBE toxin-antitoxin system